MSSVRRSSVVKAHELSPTTEDPDHDDAKVLNCTHRVREVVLSAESHYKAGTVQTALTECEKALSIAKDLPDQRALATRVLTFKILNLRAMCLVKLKRYDEAIVVTDEALKLEVSTEKAYMCRAIAQRGNRDLDSALHSIRLACRAAPEKSQYIALHAAILKQKGGSEELCQDASPTSTARRSSSALQGGDDSALLEDLLGTSRSNRESMEVAEEDCQRGVQLGTLSEEHEREIAKIRFMAKRGEALSHIGRFGDALRDVDAVLALCPQDEAARLLRIECLIGLKDHPSALQELRKACKDFPQNEHLRDLLVDLTAQDVVQLRPASPNNKT